MRHKMFFACALAAFLAGLSACGNYQEQLSSQQLHESSADSTLSYQTVRDLVFAPNCFECHSAAGGNADNLNFETYASTYPNVQDIESEVESNDMPLGGPDVPDNEKAILFAWIAAGAPETSDLPLPGPSPTPTPTPTPSPSVSPAPSPSPTP